jgi:hypothetical protein
MRDAYTQIYDYLTMNEIPLASTHRHYPDLTRDMIALMTYSRMFSAVGLN